MEFDADGVAFRRTKVTVLPVLHWRESRENILRFKRFDSDLLLRFGTCKHGWIGAGWEGGSGISIPGCLNDALVV